MKKFSFRLQPVHDLREARREQAELSLAAASARVRAEALRVEEARREHARAAEAAASFLLEGPLDPSRAELSFNYLSALERRARDAAARLARLEEERARARQTAAEAAREAEATARLRESQRDRHAQMVQRAEQVMLDEMASLAQARAMTGGEVDRD